MNDGLKVGWQEWHYIILRKVIKMELRFVGCNGIISSLGKSSSYLRLHYKAALGDLFGRANVIR